MPGTARGRARPLSRPAFRLLLTAVIGALLPLAPTPASAAPATTTAVTTTKGTAARTPGRAAPRVAARGTSRAERIAHALRIARKQIGDRYRYGAAGPRRFDCSGLVYYATHRAGLRRVPRTSSEQAAYMRPIRRRSMQRGEFVFFTSGSGVYHVGFYAGRTGGRRYVLHAPSTGSRVSREPVWTNDWFPGTLRR